MCCANLHGSASGISARAANPNPDPAQRVQLQKKLEERDDSRSKKVILVLGLGFLIAVLTAFIAGCIWVKNYLGE